MNKRIILMVATASIISGVITSSGVRFINNTSPYSSYIISQKNADKINSIVKQKSDLEEQFSQVSNKTDLGLTNKESYLVKNNIISLIDGISVDKFGTYLHYSNPQINSTVNSSVLLMNLYKCFYGVIPSRPLVFTVLPSRDINGKLKTVTELKGYTPKSFKILDSNKLVKFNDDRDVYETPNDINLYLNKLTDLGILSKSDLNYKYTSGADNTSVPYYVTKTNYKNAPLGDNWTVSSSFNAKENYNNLVNFSSFTYMDYLNYVSKILKLNKVTVSSKDLKGAYFNYGRFYSNLNQTDISTLNYLVSLGIIQPTNKSFLGSLYSSVTYNEQLNILYAIKNKTSRLKNNLTVSDTSSSILSSGDYVKNTMRVSYVKDFSSQAKTLSVREVINNSLLVEPSSSNSNVQSYGNTPTNSLTSSSDKINTINVNPSKPTDVKTTSIIGDVKKGISDAWKGIKHFFEGATTDNDPSPSQIPKGSINNGSNSSQNNSYVITKVFPDISAYEFKGTPLTTLKSDTAQGISVSSQTKGKNATSEEITFRVNASNQAIAIAILDSELTETVSGIQNFSNLSTITRITKGNVSETYVSQSAINSAFSNIQIVGSRILRNKETGTYAYISDKNNLSLVGNEVIKDGQYMLIDDNGKVYYNISVIMNLLRNSEITRLNKFNILQVSKLPKEQLVPVMSNPSHGTGALIQNAYVVSQDQVNSNVGNDNGVMYNINQLTKGVSTTMRVFPVKSSGGSVVPCTVVVNWHYAMPTNFKGNTTTDSLSKLDDGSFSVKDASDFLYTKPTDKQLSSWWDSNITLDNSLADFMYGMPDTNIIKSGFLEPDITVLCNSTAVTKQDVLNQVFDGKLEFPKGYVSSSIGDIKSSSSLGGQGWLDLFNQTTGPSAFRHFGVLFGKPSGAFLVYNNDYIADSAGNIFRLVSSDPRVSYDGKDLVVNTRTKPLVGTLQDKQIYTFQGNQYQFMGYTKNGLYATLVAIKPLTGPIVKDPSGTMTITDSSRNTNYFMDYMNEIVDPLTPGTYMTPTVSNMSLVPTGKYMQPGNYVIQGNAYSWTGSKKTQLTTLESNIQGSTFPTIYLNRTDYTIYSSQSQNIKNDIIYRPVNPALVQGNIFYTGINNSMINSILAHCEGQKNIMNIPQGSTVDIGDLVFKVSGNSLVSYPISGSFAGHYAKALASGNVNQEQTQLQSVTASLLSGITMYYGQRPVPFASYINRVGIGQPLNGVSTKGELVASGQQFFTYPNSSYTSGQVPSSVSVSIQPNSMVKFLLIDKKNNVYTLVTNTDDLNSGYLTNTSMFNDSLDLNLDDDIFARMQKPVYQKLTNAKAVMAQWEKYFHHRKESDIQRFFKYVILAIIKYLMVMPWIIAGLQRIPAAYQILMDWKYPSSSSLRGGFNPTKWACCWLLDFETRFPIARLIIADLMLGCLLLAIKSFM